MPYIYALADPDTREIRYVGKTVKSIAKRRAQHLYSSKIGEKSHKAKWIRLLLSEDRTPDVILLEEVLDHQVEEREKYWIGFHNQNGRLTNHQLGGGGGSPRTGQYNHKAKYSSDEVRQAVVLYVMGCTHEQILTLSPFQGLSGKTLRSWAQKEVRVADTLGIPTKRGYNALSK